MIVTLKVYHFLLFFLILVGLSVGLFGQEQPKRVLTPNESGAEILFQELDAADGSTLYMTMVEGSAWVACRGSKDYHVLNGLKENEKKWKDRIDLEEAKNACVQADDLDLVLVGPSQVKGTLAVSFQDRADVHRSLAWFIDCEALPRVAEVFCAYE